MDIENELIKLYYNFIKTRSIYGDVFQLFPDVPQSFLKFPTIVFKESNSSDYIEGKTLNRQEYMDRLTYIVEIYSKDIVVNNQKKLSIEVIKELKNLTHEFFNQIGFRRISSSKGEYLDLSIDRHICIFDGKINNWNGKII